MREKGMFFGPIDPEMKLPWTATRDMGTEAARLLRDRDWSGQETVPVVGPEELSHNDIAAILSDLAGREIRYVQTDWDQFRQGFIGRGVSPSFADGYVAMYRAKGEGMDNAAADGADRLGRITFREWAEHSLKPVLAG